MNADTASIQPLLLQSIDTSSLPATAVNLQLLKPMLGWTDGRTDRRTPYRFIDPAPAAPTIQTLKTVSSEP